MTETRSTRDDPHKEPPVSPDLKTIIFPVKDLAQAKTLYGSLLGQEPVMDEPYYVQFNAGDQEIGLDPNGHGKGMSGPVPYWHVEDIKATVAQLLAAGATEQQAVNDVGGRLIATLTDADGNTVGLTQAL
jgi:predicted enzyme related to lactoylglutathione lyase